MLSITAVIPCNNEEENIEAALKSVQWADKILVVDSFSDDDTVKLAKKYTDWVVQRKYSSPADQKNWAIEQVKTEWVLLLDADERVTEALKNEIQQLLKNSPTADAYWIRRKNYFMGRRIRFSGWRNDKVVRLIRQSTCRYNDKQVHEEIKLEGIKVGMLQQPMLHFTFKNEEHFFKKQERYARWSAQDYDAKTPKVTWWHLYAKPFVRFIKHYILQLGILDGRQGFIISKYMAWGVYLRYQYLKKSRA